jgi:hypothetical protein
VTETVRIYINARAVEVPASLTALQAVESWDREQAAAVRSGERLITDSRGLPADPESPVHGGAIFRIVRKRGSTPDLDENATL